MPNSISISCLATLIWSFNFLLHSHSFSTHTNETDHLALLAIKSQLHDPLGVTSSWNNSINLCQWTGVTCGHRHQKVTEVDLRNQNLGGSLSPYLGNLSFLRYINLADNNFHGEIPREIGRLFRLESLVLANNSFSELSKATNEFSSSNMIGQGSFGFVYRGLLGENGILVAVKVLNLLQKGAFKSFMAECDALRNIRHRNLIKIITICSSIDFKGDDFKALVYEYMQNGSLEEWLHPSNDQLEVCNLSLIQRLNIAIDVASAIEYLHHHCQPPIVHGDLKPSNVLLDHDMVAHVGDFGLAKFLFARTFDTVMEAPSSSIGIKGTVGYVAPEYGMGSEASVTGDVYSFGILLLEMFTRRRPTNSMFHEGSTLHEFCRMDLPEKVMEIVDPSLLLDARVSNSRSAGDESIKVEECLVTVIRIGVLSSMESPIERMEMRNVVAKLCAARENFIRRMV